VGRVTQDDPANASDVDGIMAYDDITDWVSFDHPWRSWGRTADYADLDGRCQSGSECQIWDWALNASDDGDAGHNAIRNVLDLPTEEDFYTHTWFAEDADACAEIAGATWSAEDGCQTRFLEHAMERFDDGTGKENGLCEANEACLYTPNIGAYQGTGTLEVAGVLVSESITLWAYPRNGCGRAFPCDVGLTCMEAVDCGLSCSQLDCPSQCMELACAASSEAALDVLTCATSSCDVACIDIGSTDCVTCVTDLCSDELVACLPASCD
jgi:hypothetical protein